jgi:hypothetical protein
MSTGESEEHKAMVRSLMKFLNDQGYQTVGASCEGYPACEPIEGRIPDFVGKNAQGGWCIGEAKTCDDMSNDRQRTDDQFRTFSSRQAVFYPSTPKACFDELKKILSELGLHGKPNVIPLQHG